MKSIPRRYPNGIRQSLLVLALSMPTVHADLVGQWRGTDYTDGQNWTSTPATGSIAATVSGSPFKVVDGYLAGTSAVNPNGGYFTVPQATSPLKGVTAMSLVAIFKPTGPGPSGGGFYQGGGLIGMEQAGVTNDWGLTWNGNRVSAAAPNAGVQERTIFSDPLPASELKVAMFTWNNSGLQQLFVNGVLVNSQQVGSTDPRNAADFGLGSATSGNSNPFTGEIAELRVYNSDESANAGTIAANLRDTYAVDALLDEASLNPKGGRFVLIDTATSQIDPAGAFTLEFDGSAVPAASIQVTKSGGRTTISYTATINPGQGYSYSLTVPKVGGGTLSFVDSLNSHRLPLVVPGLAGSVGSWGIREILTGATPLPANASTIATAFDVVNTNPATAESSAPVFNHSDPETNGADSVGNFNNDFKILTDAAEDQNFVVVGKTQITITTPGEIRTFSIHSDDGYAMRITGTGGGRFIDVGGAAQIDGGDVQTLFFDAGTGDSNSRGIYRFDAAGTYDITYLGWDGGAGGYYEVASALGKFYEDRDTNSWHLVGNDTAPSIPPFRDRYVANPPGIAAESGSFGVRTFLATGATDLGSASNFLRDTLRNPDDGLGTTIDAQVPYLNHRDPNNGGINRFPDDLPFPGNTGADEDQVVTVAKGRLTIPATGAYTFITTSDDGVIVRLKGVDGNPDPSFRRVTAPTDAPRFQMSNPNEFYFNAANVEIRGIVDLAAGSYDVEFIQVENVGGFAYELGVAAGEWPNATNPPNGFQLVGVPAATIALPAIKAPGWTVESSIPGLNQFAGTIVGAEAKISYTQGLATSDPIWASLGLDPANRSTVWPRLDFNDPQDGPEGGFAPTSPWPLNTPNADNDYALRATGTLVITQAGYYHLGFQGDDGGYMYLFGTGGNPNPVFESIVFTNLPGTAVIGTAPDSTVNNAIRVDAGTGNSRTLVRTFLAVGEYQIRTLVFEGGGGSWWEVIGGAATPAFNYPLLTTTAGSVLRNSGLALIEQPNVAPTDPNFALTSLVLTGNPVTSVSFNIVSQNGVSYAVQGSVDLVNWIDLQTNVVGTGTSTAVTVNLADHPTLNNQPKVFFRALYNP